MKVKVAQSCPTLCNHTDYKVHGILQARILEWVAFPFSRGSSHPRDWTQVSHIVGGFFTSWATQGKPIFSNLKIFLIVNAVTWFKIHTCKGLTKRNPPTFISNHWVPPKVTVVHLYSYTLCIVSCCSGPKSFLTPRPHGLQHARLLCPVYKKLSLCILPLLCNGSMLYVLCTSCYSTLNMSWKVFSLVHKERYLFYGIQASFSFFQQCF